MKTRLKIGDFLVYAFILSLIGASFLWMTLLKTRGGERRVTVEVKGKIVNSFMLHPDMEPKSIRIDGGNGRYNILEVGYDGVRIKEANCPDQICVHWGIIRDPGQTIVCLPHRMVIKITGQGEEAPIDELAS